MRNAQIAGIGHYLPEHIVTNHDLQKMMDTSDEWIQERTGIQTRRWIKKGDTVTSMAREATNMALQRAGMAKEDLDCIVFSCVISDDVNPGAACFLQGELGLPGIPAIDIRNGCSGFIYALSVANQFIKTGMYENILVVGSEVISPCLDKTTRGRDTAVIFADGAGVVILKATDDNTQGILTTHLHADGRYAKKLGGFSKDMPQTMSLENGHTEGQPLTIIMEGREVFKHAVTKFPKVIEEALQATGYTTDDLDLVIPHQANLRISQAVTKRLNLPPQKMVSNIEKYGNTTSASIPIAMSEAWEDGRMTDGALVCLASFGSGFTWASALVRF